VISGVRSYILTATLILGAAAGGEPARRETPLAKARRLASSKNKQDRILALKQLKALGKPGTTSGDEALYRYGELCLRFHGEGEGNALAEARRAFADLKKNAGSRWGLRGQIGLWRVLALEGKRAEAINKLVRFLGQKTRCERAVESGYYLGCMYAQSKNDVKQLKLALAALEYALSLHQKRLTGLSNAARHLRTGVSQAGPAGEIYVVVGREAAFGAGTMADFVKYFKPHLPGVRFHFTVFDELLLPPLGGM